MQRDSTVDARVTAAEGCDPEHPTRPHLSARLAGRIAQREWNNLGTFPGPVPATSHTGAGPSYTKGGPMATYRKADKPVQSMAAELIRDCHPDLAEAGVTVQVLFAAAPRNAEGEPQGPAIKATHGYPAAGKAKINSQKDRVGGLADATILVDGDRWDEWTEAEQRALLDHELQHFELRRDDEGAPLLDDCHRPKLKYRMHDFELGGFAAILRRHGELALEAQAARKIADEYGQLLFGFASAVA